MTPESQQTSRARRWIELAVILIPVAVFAYFAFAEFWTHPSSKDPVNYLQPALWRDLSVTTYPTRLMVTLGMFFSNALSYPFIREAALRYGAFHPLLVNVLCLTIGGIYCYRKAGLTAGVVFTTLLSTTFLYVVYSNEAYPDVDLTLYTLLGGICVMGEFRHARGWLPATLLCGVCCVCLALTKATALASLAVIGLYLIAQRRNVFVFIGGCLVGCLLIAAVGLLAFDWATFAPFFGNLRERFSAVVDAMTDDRWNVEISTYESFVDWRVFPFLPVLLACAVLWRERLPRFWFTMAAAHVLLLGLIVALSEKLRTDNWIYFYTATTCAALGFSLGIGRIMQQGWRGRLQKWRYKHILGLVAALTLALLAALSLHFGVTRPDFALRPEAQGVPIWFRVIYGVGPMALLLLMLAATQLRSALLTCVLLAGLACWCPYYHAAHATPYFGRHQEIRSRFHGVAAAMLDVVGGYGGVLVKGYEIEEYDADEHRNAQQTCELYYRDQVRALADEYDPSPPRNTFYLDSATRARLCQFVIVDAEGRAEIESLGIDTEVVAERRSGALTLWTLKVGPERLTAPPELPEGFAWQRVALPLADRGWPIREPALEVVDVPDGADCTIHAPDDAAEAVTAGVFLPVGHAVGVRLSLSLSTLDGVEAVYLDGVSGGKTTWHGWFWKPTSFDRQFPLPDRLTLMHGFAPPPFEFYKLRDEDHMRRLRISVRVTPGHRVTLHIRNIEVAAREGEG